MKKVIITAALLTALFSTASSQQLIQNETYVGVKHPVFLDSLKHWHYDRTGFVETLTSKEVNTWIRIDWTEKKVTVTDGTEYTFEFTTNERNQSQTYWYGGQKLIVFFNSKAEYIGHRIED